MSEIYYLQHYDLYLHPDLKNDTFSGRVAIEIASDVARDFFVVHVKYLNVTKTALTSSDGAEVTLI